MSAHPIKSLFGRFAYRVRTRVHLLRFRRRVRSLRKIHGDRIRPRHFVQADADSSSLEPVLRSHWGRDYRTIALVGRFGGQDYRHRFSSWYGAGGHGREKALEHALSFELLDFSSVRRFCDVAASASPMEKAVAELWPGVERWKQDFEYTPDPSRRVLGGLAQKMDGVPDGFFDALTLHCSFEHFHGHADTALMGEIDRVLSSRGACLILPLYLDIEHKIFFDPLRTPAGALFQYDPEARLCPAFDYRQRHGRYYDPASLERRVRDALPGRLCATLLRFTGQEALGPGVYLQHGLVLHRRESIYRA